MKTNLQRLLVLLILACLSRPASDIAVGQTSNGPQPAKKRVYSNEDLDKYQEKYGGGTVSSKSASADLSSTGKATDAGANTGDKEEKGKPKPDLVSWRTKLKGIEDNIAAKKKMEGKLTDSLSKYSQKLAEADTEFYKTTAQQQVAGVQENLVRTQAELKRAEEEKAKLLSDARKAGIKEEELIEPASNNGPKQ